MKQLPVAFLELAAVQMHVVDVHGLQVLDLACGTGSYSRMFIEWGASKVVGVDISQAMIDDARSKNTYGDRLEFRVAGCSKPLQVGKFDIVLGSWLLNYASGENELLAMWRNIVDNLKHGGRFVGILPNPDILKAPFPEGRRFGFEWFLCHEVERGIEYQITAHTRNPFSVCAYLLDQELHESCASQAGFYDFQWMQPVDPNNADVDFDEFLSFAAIVAVVGSLSRTDTEE